MAESDGLLGISGTDGESGVEGTSSESPGRLDPTAAALAAEAARSDSELARKASAYFDRQSRLVEIQTEHLHEQRAVNLSLLKLRRFGERLKVGLQVFITMIASVIAVVLVRIVWSALVDQHLVVEAFSVPPEMSTRGITGQVLAAQVLDKLGQINARANSTRAASSYAANWGEQAKIQIPEAGVSIEELQRFFRDWLGHETHVTGEVISDAGTLSLTVRAGEKPGRMVRAPESDLSALTQQAAEAVFAITQPYRYSVYLDVIGHPDQALEVARALTRDGSTRERAWAYTQVSNVLLETGHPGDAARAVETSISLDHHIPVSYMDASNAYYLLGDEQKALEYMQRLTDSVDSGAVETSSDSRQQMRNWAGKFVAYELGAYRDAMIDMSDPKRIYGDAVNAEGFTNEDFLRNQQAYILALAHDVRASLAMVADHPMSDADALTDAAYADDAHVAAYERAVANDDWLGAATDMRDTIAAASRWSAFAPIVVPLLLKPRLAYALARDGKQLEAEQIAVQLPQSCYRCARARGWVATTAHNWQRADRDFAEAVRQAPSLPGAYYDWGASLLARGDTEGALQKFEAAHKRGPHFADPLKAWGDILVKQGKTRQALAKYDEALEFAPNWQQLKDARDAAAQ